MHLNRLLYVCILLISCIATVGAQRLIRGHVYGARTSSSPVDSMRIHTYRGQATFSDQSGFYQISSSDPQNDTLYVSFKGREVMRYPISHITTPEKFDIYLQNPGFYDNSYFNELEEVHVRSRNYHTDSLENRRLYEDIFNYRKPKFNPMHPITSAINIFRQPYLNRQKRYQQFAITSEQEGYVNSRYTVALVASLTGMQDDDLIREFMKKYRPTYEQMKGMVDLTLGQFIVDNYKKFKIEKGLK